MRSKPYFNLEVTLYTPGIEHECVNRVTGKLYVKNNGVVKRGHKKGVRTFKVDLEMSDSDYNDNHIHLPKDVDSFKIKKRKVYLKRLREYYKLQLILYKTHRVKGNLLN
jgi:hypothetical protein